MVDQLDNNTRSPNPDAEIDDPLAELARIIGYERPGAAATPVDHSPQSSEFDLEAELMRELDVPELPAIDELDLIEADEATSSPVAEAHFEPVEDEQPLDTSPWLDAPEEEQPEWQSSDELSSETLSARIEEELLLDEVQDPLSEPPLYDQSDADGVWDDPGIEPDLDLAEIEGFDDVGSSEPEPETSGRVINADFGTSRLSPVQAPEDDVLADMYRFELPGFDRPNAVPAQPASAYLAPLQDQVESDTAEDVQGQKDHFPGDLEEFDDLGSLEAFEAEQVADPLHASLTAADEQPAADVDVGEVDFEDFLSSELDVFGREMAMGHTDDAVAEKSEANAFAHADSVAEVGDIDWDGSSDDSESSVFDEAAEELLADIADEDDAAPENEVATDASENWSVESIEQATVEELDDELEDIFGLPEPQASSTADHAEDIDDFDLDFDLDEVLAETALEPEKAWVEPENAVAIDALTEPALPDADRDEMTEAFLGLVPAGEEQAPEHEVSDEAPSLAIVSNEPADAVQDDWLEGFETSDTAETPGQDDYFFDAQLIADTDDTVEAVGDIDVPELVHDEPQLAEPDYETEIEREFADLVERQEPVSAEASETVTGAGFVAAEAWSRSADGQRGYEISDDYIELERELDAVGDPAARPGHGMDEIGQELASASSARDEFIAGEPARSTGARGPVLALIVLGVAVFAGAGAFGWSMLSSDDTTADGGPRIIRADKDPVKVLPENPGGVTVPNQDKAVYDRVAGGASNASGQPALVNSAEEPIDVVQRTLDPEILPLEGRGDPAVKSEERLSAGENGSDLASNGASAPVVSPRRVRTMIVKPDGSIVAREEPSPAVETVSPEPAASTSGETVAAEASPTQDFVVSGQSAPAAQAVDTAGVEQVVPPTASDVATDTDTDTQVADQSIAPVRVVTTQPIRAPVPQSRPAEQPVNVVGTVSQGGTVGAAPTTPQVTPSAPAPTEPVAVAQAPAAAAPVANPGGYYMQIASQPTEEGAQASWRTLSSRYSSVIGGMGVDIQRADITGKGVFHRVRVPAGSRDQANALCARYKSAGGSCFVSR